MAVTETFDPFMVATIELEPGTTPVPYLSPQGNGLDELRVRLTRTT